MNWDLYLNFFAAMMAISNPLGKIPIWTELTSDKEALIDSSSVIKDNVNK